LQSLFWLRILVVLPLLLIFLLAQRYWFRTIWGAAGSIRRLALRRFVRGLVGGAFLFVAMLLVVDAFLTRRDVMWRYAGVVGLVGLWVTSSLWAYFGVKAVAVADWLRGLAVRAYRFARRSGKEPETTITEPVDDMRREFLRTATLVAGAIPFACGGYGFLIGRHEYQVREVTLPLAGWPAALDNLRIVQLSDVHIGSYMSASDVRRVVDMSNGLGAHLATVTGDFLTGAGDPLEDCIRELSRLRAPLGVWGCNGNHEIYADAQEEAARLFARYGMALLRQQRVELVHHSHRFNLMGVDYQMPRDLDGRPLRMLEDVETLVQRDMPNILLSHNPNSFPRAAELGIDLSLAGHTHGGQVKVEILDHRLSPARFLTPYTAGLFKRPLGAAAGMHDEQAWSENPAKPASLLYVNRGLGTIFAPIRLGVPPEISLLTLRRG
jgi:uncharacterized protein